MEMHRTKSKAAVSLALSVGLTALALPGAAGAHNPKVDGVSAYISHGTLVVKDGDRSNRVALHLAPADPNVIEVGVNDDAAADYSFARSDVTEISVRMGDGDDTVVIADATAPLNIPTTISGGDGDDRLLGGQGGETFRGGDGDDLAVGGKGADTAYLGAGDDVFVWNPGDGSDVVEGQAGTDEMAFNGAAGGETVSISASDHRLIFFRQPGNVTMDNNGVEVVDFNALGGQDNVTVGDVTGTDLKQTNIDLAAALGGGEGDHLADSVTVQGTDGDDTISVAGSGSRVDVTGLATNVSITHPDSIDNLSVDTRGGTDNVLTQGLGGLINLLVDGVPSS
jgi:RTX calcium-binding nonapeptide repeat (4 copies)